jgi:transcriptional regulator with XRE-family HTH domain
MSDTIHPRRIKISPSDRVRRVCDENGLRPIDLADLLQTDRRTVNRWLCGDHEPPHSVTLLMMAYEEGIIDLTWIRARRKPARP